MKKWHILTFACIFGLALFAEIALRTMGLRQLPLYRQDTRYEYVCLPDQSVSPKGNLYKTNGSGLRSGAIGKKKGKRVLVIGDSVLNGGYNIPQDKLAITILQDSWALLPDALEVINLSMNSWGPDNAAAFIEAHGTFNPDLVILVVSSHDAHDNMTFEPIVGKHPSYPGQKPLFALQTFWRRIIHRFFTDQGTAEYKKLKGPFNSGFEALYSKFHNSGIPFHIYLHYQTDELEVGLADRRGQEIIAFAEKNDIRLHDGKVLGEKPHHYADIIHFNQEGQAFLAIKLQEICDLEWGK